MTELLFACLLIDRQIKVALSLESRDLESEESHHVLRPSYVQPPDALQTAMFREHSLAIDFR